MKLARITRPTRITTTYVRTTITQCIENATNGITMAPTQTQPRTDMDDHTVKLCKLRSYAFLPIGQLCVSFSRRKDLQEKSEPENAHDYAMLYLRRPVATSASRSRFIGCAAPVKCHFCEYFSHDVTTREKQEPSSPQQ